jgi:hypothetical protein
LKKGFIIALLFLGFIAKAEGDSTRMKINFSAYLDTYYSYDLNRPSNHVKPGFIYSYNRHNEFNVNLGYIKANVEAERCRANLALMAGTYSQYNLASEPEVLRHIYEANIGVKIAKNKNLWIDAGIFQSHIGFESPASKSSATLTRSIMADNSPYYESGAKISYTSDDGKWFLSALALNGWQRIKRPDGNSTPAFGTQITFKPSDKVLLNYSTFIGSDKPDSAIQMRYFNDVYGVFSLSPKWNLTLGFDYGLEQKSKGSDSYNSWMAPIVIVQYKMNKKSAFAARVEYYYDPNSVIIQSISPNGFRTSGFSLNYDQYFTKYVLWRSEARWLKSIDHIFIKQGGLHHDDIFLTTALIFSLNP